jgi:hypothetical protein
MYHPDSKGGLYSEHHNDGELAGCNRCIIILSPNLVESIKRDEQKPIHVSVCAK